MHEYAARFADLLEQVALKVRALTVDRVARIIKLTGLGILTASLVLTTLVFLLWAIFGALEIPLTTAGAFGVYAAVLIGAGGYLWFTRSDEASEEE
jgi:uncharacterized YccA/Bax inhibitor family protein